MKRREFLKASVLGITSSSVTGAMGGYLTEETTKKPRATEQDQSPVDGGKVYGSDGRRLFPSGLPRKQWVRFESQGFSQPACGIVYRREDVVPHGMPLGGVATGYLDIDTDGNSDSSISSIQVYQLADQLTMDFSESAAETDVWY